MRKWQLASAFLALVACAAPCAAQRGEKGKETPPAVEGAARDTAGHEEAAGPQDDAEARGGLKPLKLPDGEGAWVLQVISRGGVAGVGRGDVAFNSAGDVACKPVAACKSQPPPEALRALSEAVAALGTKSADLASKLACHDCYTTSILLQRREAGGAVRTHLFRWDDLSTRQVPADVLRLYDAALAAARAN